MLNILEVSCNSPSLRSGGEKTSIALGRGARARRSANEIGEGSEVVAEASGLMTLEASREKKRTFWPVPGVFGSRKMDLTLLNLPSDPRVTEGVMEGVSRDGRDGFWCCLYVSELGRAVSELGRMFDELRERESCEAVQLVKLKNERIPAWTGNTYNWT
jgi:hypothetical protein